MRWADRLQQLRKNQNQQSCLLTKPTNPESVSFVSDQDDCFEKNLATGLLPEPSTLYDPDHDGSPPQVVDHRGTIMTQPLDCWIRQIATWLGHPVNGEVGATSKFVSVSIPYLELGRSHNGMTYLDWVADYGATSYAEWCQQYGYDPSSPKAQNDYDHYLDGAAQMVESFPLEKAS